MSKEEMIEEIKKMTVVELAIGKAGQNARLAAKLTNWKIDIKSESQFRQILQEQQNQSEEENEKIENNENENKE